MVIIMIIMKTIVSLMDIVTKTQFTLVSSTVGEPGVSYYISRLAYSICADGNNWHKRVSAVYALQQKHLNYVVMVPLISSGFFAGSFVHSLLILNSDIKRRLPRLLLFYTVHILSFLMAFASAVWITIEEVHGFPHPPKDFKRKIPILPLFIEWSTLVLVSILRIIKAGAYLPFPFIPGDTNRAYELRPGTSVELVNTRTPANNNTTAPTSGTVGSSEPGVCSTCLDDKEGWEQLDCSHWFHKACIAEVRRRQYTPGTGNRYRMVTDHTGQTRRRLATKCP